MVMKSATAFDAEQIQLTFCPEMPYSCGGNHDDARDIK
jgi:hypothetical protein